MPNSPLLGITELTPTQTGKENTINNAILALEAAGNATLAVSLAAGDYTLSQNEFFSNFVFKVSGQTAAHVVNIPAAINGNPTSRVFTVRNAGNFQITVQVTGAPGTVQVLQPNEARLLDVDGAGNVGVTAQPPSAFAVWTDATTARTLSGGDANAYVRMTNALANTVTIPDNATVPIPIGTRVWIEQAGAGRTTVVAAVGVTVRQPSAQAQLYLRSQYSQVWATKVGTDEWNLAGDFGGLRDYSVGGGAPNNIQSNEYLLDHIVSRAFTLPANFAGSQAGCGTNPTATYVLAVFQTTAGVTTQIGTITIATNGAVTLATTGGAAFAFSPGDVIAVQAPSTVDGTIARVRFTLRGTD